MTAPSTDNENGGGGTTPRPLRDGIDTARSQLNDVAETARDKAAKAVDATKEGLGQAKETLSGAISTGRDKAADAFATSRDTAVDVLASSRERASDAYVSTRTRAKAVVETTSEKIEASPLVALIGGLAAGVVLGALLPRTERETQALGGVSQKLNGLAKEALDAARDAGEAKLAELGLTPDKARESLHTLIDGAMAAATSAGSAAVDTTRTKAPTEGEAA